MSKLRLGLVVAAAVGLVGPAAPRATAFTAKCQPNVRVVNNKNIAIKVTKFKYKVGNGTEVFTESLLNKNLSPGETENWPSQRLGSAVLGVVVTSTAVEYKNDTSGSGSAWGSPQLSDWFPHSFTCADNHNYIQTVP